MCLTAVFSYCKTDIFCIFIFLNTIRPKFNHKHFFHSNFVLIWDKI